MKACEGGCGRRVSLNKVRCLECLAKEVKFRLTMGGIEAEPEEIERALYRQIER